MYLKSLSGFEKGFACDKIMGIGYPLPERKCKAINKLELLSIQALTARRSDDSACKEHYWTD
jgi:hypothetical protein